MRSYSSFRVVKHVGHTLGKPYVYYTVHEVFYEEGKLNSLTPHEVAPGGETLAAFMKSWAQYQRALEKDPLCYDHDLEAFIPNEDVDRRPEHDPAT